MAEPSSLCEKCDQRVAVVHLSRVETGEVVEMHHYCQRCANQTGFSPLAEEAAERDEGSGCKICRQIISISHGWEAMGKDKRRKHWCVPCSIAFWEFLNAPENSVPSEFDQLAAGEPPVKPSRRALREAALEHVRIQAGKRRRKRWPD